MNRLETIWQKLEGYLLIPHELLHVVGYRLVGKRGHYRWGEPRVLPQGSMRRWERLVGLLSPFVVCSLGCLGLIVWLLGQSRLYLSGSSSPGLLVKIGILGAGTLICYLNAAASLLDLHQAYCLLTDRPADHPTIFSRLPLPTGPLSPQRQVFAWALIVICLIVLFVMGQVG